MSKETTWADRFDEKFSEVILDQEVRTVVKGIKAFISQERKLAVEDKRLQMLEIHKALHDREYDLAYHLASESLQDNNQ